MKLKRTLSYLCLRSIFVIVLGSIFTNIALAEPSTEKANLNSTPPAQLKPETAQNEAASTNPGQLPDKFISDGAQLDLKDIGLKIAPVAGWEVITNNPSISLVIQEPTPEKVEYEKPIYQRNITVTTRHKPSPIDDNRAETLKKEIVDGLTKDPTVKDVRISEHQYFDYRKDNRGLVVYTEFKSQSGPDKTFDMKQMHILISGQEKHYLLTYTDLAERFDDEQIFAKVWNTMATIEVSGNAPIRYAELIKFGGIGAGVLLLIITLMMIRSRRARNRYLSEADEIYNDEQWSFDDSNNGSLATTTNTGIWHLTSAGELNLDDGKDSESLSFVSNFS